MNRSNFVPSLVVVVLIGTLASAANAHPGSGIAVGNDGTVYFTDTGKGVWQVGTDGRLALVSSEALHWMAIDHHGKFAHAPDAFGEYFWRVTTKGAKPTLVCCSDFPCVIGRDESLYYPYMHGLNIKRRTSNGTVTNVVTREKFKVGADRPISVLGIACGPRGQLYAVSLDDDSGEHTVWEIDLNGAVRPFSKNFIQDQLPAAERHPEVRPEYCRGVAVDQMGNVFVAATGSRVVMKLHPDGEAEVILRSAKPWTPTGVDVHGDDVFVLEYDDETPTEGRAWPPRVRKVSKDGKVSVLAAIDRQDSAQAADR